MEVGKHAVHSKCINLSVRHSPYGLAFCCIDSWRSLQPILELFGVSCNCSACTIDDESNLTQDQSILIRQTMQRLSIPCLLPRIEECGVVFPK